MSIIKTFIIILFIVNTNKIKSQIEFDSNKNIVNFLNKEIDSIKINLKFNKTLTLDSCIKFEIMNQYLNRKFYVNFLANYCKNDSITLIDLDNVFSYKILKQSISSISLSERENKLIYCKFYINNKKLTFNQNGFLKINITIFENHKLMYSKPYFIPLKKIKKGIPYW